MRFLTLTLSILSASSSIAQVKVYISADMEGVGGVVTDEQLGPRGFEYQRFREFMTEEVLAAIRGARVGGATEILVSDSHGNGQNLLIEKLPEDVELVRSWPRPLGMMEGIDETFDAAIFIGYHSSTSNPAGVRAHTFSSATLTDVKLNGVSVSEAGFNAAIAGHFGVPVVMVSGDDTIIAEARKYIGDLEGAEVKRAPQLPFRAISDPAGGLGPHRRDGEAGRRAPGLLEAVPPPFRRDARRELQELPTGRDARLSPRGRADGRSQHPFRGSGHARGLEVRPVHERIRDGPDPVSSAGYSGTPLPRKLGIKQGSVVALAGAPRDFRATLGDLPPGVKLLSSDRRGDVDLILLFVRDRAELEAKLSPTVSRMGPETALWICWPKKASPLASDVDENVVRARGLAAGIVDIKICAVDHDWSGLKWVYRLKDRPSIRASKARKKTRKNAETQRRRDAEKTQERVR